MHRGRIPLAVAVTTVGLLVGARGVSAASLPTLPPVAAGITAGSGPTATVTINLPAGQSTNTAPGGSTSQAGAASGSSSAAPFTDPTGNVCVSCTSATSQGGSGSARANELALMGDGFSGGGADGNSSGSGSIVAVAAGPAVSAQVARWMASSSSSGSSGTSTAGADLVSAQLGQQLVTVGVLDSQSNAGSSQDSTGSTGSGSSSTSGLTLGGLNGAVAVILVHSDSSSNGQGSAYLASLNGQEIGSTGTSSIPIVIPGVGTIDLVPASSSGGQSSAGGANADASVAGQHEGTQFSLADAAATGGTNGRGGVEQSKVGFAAAGQNNSSVLQAKGGAPIPGTGVALSMLAILLIVGGGAVLACGRTRFSLRPRSTTARLPMENR